MVLKLRSLLRKWEVEVTRRPLCLGIMGMAPSSHRHDRLRLVVVPAANEQEE
jgi:hypothetical protein